MGTRKIPKLLHQVLKDDMKIEAIEHSVISPSTTRVANQPIIKTEPDLFESNVLQRRLNHSNSQSTLLRSLIRTPSTPSAITKKDAPLYDLLQNLDSNNLNTTNTTDPLDPFEQYLTPVTNNISLKDDYLAELLSSDPQKPNEISLLPCKTGLPQEQNHNENNRIHAIANDLFQSTNLSTNSNDNFLSLLENKDFLDSINDSTTIDSILSQNSTNLIEQTFPTQKRSEKDEKAISEIYKTLVTSFNPGLLN